MFFSLFLKNASDLKILLIAAEEYVLKKRFLYLFTENFLLKIF